MTRAEVIRLFIEMVSYHRQNVSRDILGSVYADQSFQVFLEDALDREERRAPVDLITRTPSGVPEDTDLVPEELADRLADLLGIDTIDQKTQSWPDTAELRDMLQPIAKAESIGNIVILTMNDGSVYHLNVNKQNYRETPATDYLWQWTSYI